MGVYDEHMLRRVVRFRGKPITMADCAKSPNVAEDRLLRAIIESYNQPATRKEQEK